MKKHDSAIPQPEHHPTFVAPVRMVSPKESSPRPAPRRATPVHPLLKMQRMYGNRVLRRTVELARQGHGESEAGPRISEAIERQRALGQPLDNGVRLQMESAFGTGFRHVRVHTGTGADQLNRALNARAFTTGRDIFFRTGEYSPHSYGGRELLAHELTHVVQQTGVVRSKLMISQPGDPYEQEADRIARAVMQREGIPVQRSQHSAGVSSIHPRVQRQFGFLSDAVGNVIERASNYIRERAQSIPGYELVGVILGRDPITQRPVERNATNLFRGLLSLIPGGTQMFENLQQSGVIQRAFTWVTGELARLNLTWPVIRGAIERFLGSLGVGDLLNLGRVFERARAIFGPIVSNLVSFARAAGSRILEFIFEGALALGGSAGQRILGIFRRIGASFSLIVNDPVRFLQNLIGSVAGAFRQFGGNILSHLRTAIFDWLFGALQGAGLQLPQRFDLKGIVSIILQILGLTYARLRARLVRVIGERPVQILEGAFEFLQILVTQGIAAAWQKILEYAENLTDTVIEGIKSWIRNTIVMQAIQQIASLLTPVGAIIQAIIKIYNTVMFVIERAQQLAAFVTSVMESLENIARGNLSSAIAYVERTLARILPLVISFLARFIGLGGISNQIRQIIQRIQGVVDRAFDRVINWIRERARAILERVTGGTSEQRVDQALIAGEAVLNRFAGKPVGRLVLRPLLGAIRVRFQLTLLEPVEDQGYWALEGAASPGKKGRRSSAQVAGEEQTRDSEPNVSEEGPELILKFVVRAQPFRIKHSLQRHHYLRLSTGGVEDMNSIMHRNLKIDVAKQDLIRLGQQIQVWLQRNRAEPLTGALGDYQVGLRSYKFSPIDHTFVLSGDKVWDNVPPTAWLATQSIRQLDETNADPDRVRRMYYGRLLRRFLAEGIIQPGNYEESSGEVELARERFKDLDQSYDTEIGRVSGRNDLVRAMRYLAGLYEHQDELVRRHRENRRQQP